LQPLITKQCSCAAYAFNQFIGRGIDGLKVSDGWKPVPIELIDAMKMPLPAMLVERLLNAHKRHKSGHMPAYAMAEQATLADLLQSHLWRAKGRYWNSG
jgi:hypothetical protein